jgi:N-acetylated-alpha-linked acidic dipeptidase
MADSERTPLLTIVRVEPPRQRYPHQGLRRFCSILLSAILLVVIVVFLLFLFVIPDCEDLRQHNHRHSKLCLSKHPFFRNHGDKTLSTISNARDGLTFDELIDILAETPDEKKAKEWSAYYTSGPHLAGKNLSQAEWTRDKWKEFGVTQTDIVAYDIYTVSLALPRGVSLSCIQSNPYRTTLSVIDLPFWRRKPRNPKTMMWKSKRSRNGK